MLIFNSVHDVLMDMVLDLDGISEAERSSLIASISGVPFHVFTPEEKSAFRSGIEVFLNKHFTIKPFYQRG